MATTTSYGTWNNCVEPYSISLAQSVCDALGDYADDYDQDAIEREYREAINDALPGSVALCGDEFIGPYYAADANFDGYPLDENGELDIKAIVNGVDFWKIAERHDLTA